MPEARMPVRAAAPAGARDRGGALVGRAWTDRKTVVDLVSHFCQ